MNSLDIRITPGNLGKDCMGNGTFPGIECMCDECDYLMCCIGSEFENNCRYCSDTDCKRNIAAVFT